MKKFIGLVAIFIGIGAWAQPQQKTVKEFLKISPSDTTSYVVKGVVSKVRSSSSGSFYLQDDSGTLLVYGIQDPERPGAGFKQLDIVKGDTLCVLGRYTLYAGTTQEMKDGRLLWKGNGPEHNLSFYDRLEKKPSFKGKEGEDGKEAFREWVQAHVTPQEGSGTVLVKFVVGRNGAVQEVEVARGVSPALNEEAVRVVKSAPKWKAAKADGAPVRVTYTIPVRF